MKHTKIITTLGSSSSTLIKEMIINGTDVFRLNFSHGNHSQYAGYIKQIRSLSNSLEKNIAIIADLQGPKIRVGQFINGYINIKPEQQVILDINSPRGYDNIIALEFKPLIKMVTAGDTLLIDDGKVELLVKKVNNSQIICQVVTGNQISSNKGINKLGGGINAASLTAKDLVNLEFALQQGVDYIALSFVSDENDLIVAKSYIDNIFKNLGLHKQQDFITPKIIAKIERYEAVYEHLEAIIKSSDAVMVARGDLAIEVGLDKVPAIQKQILNKCQQFDCMAIVATQMLESMINSTVATRAEVSDIANAILDGADAVMLSAETAIGSYPISAIRTMNKTCLSTESVNIDGIDINFINKKFINIELTVAMATLFSAYHLKADAIIVITASGHTAYQLSRIRIGIPIFAISDNQKVCQQMSILRSVYPLYLSLNSISSDVDYYQNAINILINKKLLKPKQKIVITFGDSIVRIGSINTMKISVL